jgi:hypothetical protein
MEIIYNYISEKDHITYEIYVDEDTIIGVTFSNPEI